MSDNKKQKPQQNQINIEVSEEIAQGIYSNLAVISHSSSEFVVDFIRMMPGAKKAQVKSRVILNPENAKRLFMALKDNLSKYESMLGEIKMHNTAPPAFPMNFGGPTAQA